MYLLTGIGLTTSSSSTVHIHTQTIHGTTQITTLVGRLSGIRTQSCQTNWKSVGRAPSLRVIPWHSPYNWGKSTEEPQSGWQKSASWRDEYRIYRTEPA